MSSIGIVEAKYMFPQDYLLNCHPDDFMRYFKRQERFKVWDHCYSTPIGWGREERWFLYNLKRICISKTLEK